MLPNPLRQPLRSFASVLGLAVTCKRKMIIFKRYTGKTSLVVEKASREEKRSVKFRTGKLLEIWLEIRVSKRVDWSRNQGNFR